MAGDGDLALDRKLMLGTETGIGQVLLLQPREVAFIDIAAFRLGIGAMRATNPRTLVPAKPHPAQVFRERGRVLFVAAHGIGILEAQQEHTAVAARQQPVEQRRADIAEMQPPGRAWRKAGFKDMAAHTAMVTESALVSYSRLVAPGFTSSENTRSPSRQVSHDSNADQPRRYRDRTRCAEGAQNRRQFSCLRQGRLLRRHHFPSRD